MPEHRYTYCRICESACGLVATVEGSTVLGLEPDREHPRSRGYACKKGVRFHRVHHDPARFLTPLWRDELSKDFTPLGWEDGLERVGRQLQGLVRDHGRESVGVFSGNAANQSLGAILGVTAFLEGLATPRHYSALTLDNAEMFVVTEACLGNPMSTFNADYQGSDFLVLFGTDPLSSQASQAQSHPDGVREILEVARRGQLVVVDPRPSLTSRKAALHLQPRPGTDAMLLAWLIREVLEREPDRAGADPLLAPADVACIRQATAAWTLDRAARETGLAPARLSQLLTRLMNAERPLVWSGLGILLGPHGTLGYWLTLVLQAVLGGLDRRGGWLQHGGPADLPALFRWTGVRGYDPDNRSRMGGFPAVLGTWASATLADDILDDTADRLRALIVVGGNPARSLPDSPRARRALASLDLLVVLDLRPTETSAMAHAVFPARSWLARADLGLHQSPTRRHADLLFTEAVVPPVGEAREDWEILTGLTRAAGYPVFGSRLADLGLRLSGAGHVGIALAGTALRSPLRAIGLRARARGLFLDEPVTGSLRRRGTDLPGGQIRLGVPRFVEALAGLETRPEPSSSHPLLQVITSVRPMDQMNTWIPARRAPESRLHPEDVARIGSQRIRIRSPGAESWPLSIVVTPDARVRPGVLVLPWGHPQLDANAVIGTTQLEPFTGQPISNGCWVEAAPDDRQGSHEASP